MIFRKEKTKDFYLLDTKIENIFINEYMPQAPGDFVKVYLYACMNAEHNVEIDNESLAKQLLLDKETVKEAFDYWEKLGVIRKSYIFDDNTDEYLIEFINQKQLMYGKSTVKPESKTTGKLKNINSFGDEALRNLIRKIEALLNRTLSSTDISKVLSWITDYQTEPEIICHAVKTGVDMNKTSMRYIEGIIRGWSEEGMTSVEQIKESQKEKDDRHQRYKRVLRALGFTRNATEEEKRIMDKWFDVMGYNMERVLEACKKTAGISSPNFNYVNKVLENWEIKAKEQGNDVNKATFVTHAVLNQYYDYLKEKAEKEAEERKAEIYRTIPIIKTIDDEIRKTSSQLSKTLIMGNSESESKKLSAKMDALSEERAVALTDNNYEMDYTDIKYKCEKCNDTGVTDLGERCSCVKTRTEEAEIWIKEKTMKKS